MPVKILVSLIPVFLFLFMLIWLDSLKLVNKLNLLLCLGWGVVSSLLCYFINTYLISLLGLRFETYSGFVAPVVEEFLKFSLLWILIARSKIGFMIDGAIYGFAVGAAFSFTENLYYLFTFATGEPNIMVWVTRGFGTAVMHGGTTAIFGIICMSTINRESNLLPGTILGALAAIFIHGIYNQFIISPVLSTVIIILLVPASMIGIFMANERSIRDWLELEFDSEVSMLRMIRKGKFVETRTGNFLVSIKDHFPADLVVDLYCFIGLYLELSMKAKSSLMLKENDIVPPRDPDLKDKLEELKALQKSIGKTGYLAIAPVLRVKRKDIWKLSLLE